MPLDENDLADVKETLKNLEEFLKLVDKFKNPGRDEHIGQLKDLLTLTITYGKSLNRSSKLEDSLFFYRHSDDIAREIGVEREIYEARRNDHAKGMAALKAKLFDSQSNPLIGGNLASGLAKTNSSPVTSVAAIKSDKQVKAAKATASSENSGGKVKSPRPGRGSDDSD